ncbi:unnamed protein product [Ceutorhynchus assimilis]|uniref:Hermansky-Pudlak syndrome 1 protein homolog n=1 Tax=Ceutorhynchus assimilis TaxID=467358 RepID=A0A9N9N240_9CUCU|nr:unnamed protein product [Ceutorhynchus assimilis]
MDCLVIFDHLNDLMFTKYNSCFEKHIKNLALSQELISKDQMEYPIDDNIFIQIFSPIVQSHQIMHYQFSNSYTTVEFSKDLNLYFQEYMGYLFMTINNGVIKHLIDMYVTFARYICGPDIYQFQANKSKATMYGLLIDKWLALRNTNQAIFVEAVEQLVVNRDISSTCIQSLRDSISKLSLHFECSKVHGLLFVDNKLLSLYSSSNAKQLSAADILFVTILINCLSEKTGTIESFQVLLSGPEQEPKCLPHAVHLIELFENVFLVYLVETVDPLVAAPLYETFLHLHKLRYLQTQRELQSIQIGHDNLSVAVKKLNDGLRKCKIKSCDALHKQLMKKWEVLNMKYKDYLKTNLNESILRAEALAINFLDDLKKLYNCIAMDDSLLTCSTNHISNLFPKVAIDLEVFKDFFKVKGIKNFSLGSRDSLTINKYLERFPGLVHFLYIDRNTHRVTTPSLDMQAEKADFIRERIWEMIDFCHSHLQEGHHFIRWQDKIFTYGYFFWFEDSTGKIPKPLANWNMGNTIPGILKEDYYLKLKTAHFPKTTPGKIRTYELFLMHLGLVTPDCMVEQARKLAATIWELKGFPSHAIDLL